MAEEKVGLANPYALAELALGRRVDWRSISDRDAFFSTTLGVSIEDLVAPAEGNPMISGMATSQDLLSEVRAEKGKRATSFTSKVKRGPLSTMLTKLAPDARARIIGALSGGEPANGQQYTPPGAVWEDPGSFFAEATEFFDPMQGGLGDCYLIAALSAVAWSRPYVIMQRTRTIGPGNQSFVDRIDFYSGGNAKLIEVTELLPVVGSTHAWIYGRSTEAGEIWPAVYEKAFAKWKTNNPTDMPDYGPIAGGWPVQATEELTNLKGTIKTCSDHTADAIWSFVRSNCLSYRTVNPMTAWTFCRTPPPVDYSGTGIYAYHAYTILGWAYVANTKYVVLRNPWGHNVAVINALAGNWSAYEQSFWRSVPLNSGGVFAIPADTFKKYYWQFGWAN
jgi:hypothetical protein